MANLTLSIDDGVLKRARIRAIEEDTSVNARVRDFLSSYADDPVTEQRKQAAAQILQLADSGHYGSGPQGRTWTRDDLYER